MDLVLWLLTAFFMLAVMVAARFLAVNEARRILPNPDEALREHPDFAVVAERYVYGMRLTELVDRNDAFADLVEIGSDGGHDFTRVTIEFPTRLKVGIHMALESEEGFFKRLMNMKETQLGHEHFDSQFIVLATNRARVERTLSEGVREAMLNVRSYVSELRVTDNSICARLPRALTSVELKEILPKIQSVAHLYYERARTVEDEFKDEIERNPEIPTPQRDGIFGISGRYPWKSKK